VKNLLLNYSFKVKAYETRDEMGKSAAEEAIETLKELLKAKEEVNCIFAAAPSQNEFLECLSRADIDWCRVNAFHMDEYIGLKSGDSRLFSSFLSEKIFNKVPFKKVYLINDAGASNEEKLENYSNLLKEKPVDITFMGIGENGHIAFNDPHVADFKDDKLVKVVDLDEKCRRQQVNDGCFATLEEVPKYAVTLTIPALMKAKKVFCIVPAKTKAEAVKNTVFGEISEKCPAAIMRTHTDAALYLDMDSAQYLYRKH
jgi:glucosamine-6-phosphate deaminase